MGMQSTRNWLKTRKPTLDYTYVVLGVAAKLLETLTNTFCDLVAHTSGYGSHLKIGVLEDSLILCK